MGQDLTVQDLHELQSLARKLRHSASATADLRYIALFLQAAAALEERISAGQPGIFVAWDSDAALHASAGRTC